MATNTGEATIEGVGGCGSTRIGMTVHGPAGPVPLTDPCIVTFGMPCLPGFMALAPGDRVESTYTYDGHQYTVCHTPETIPPGTYEIVATFTWYSRGTRLKTLTRRLPFDWPAP